MANHSNSEAKRYSGIPVTAEPIPMGRGMKLQATLDAQAMSTENG